MIKNGIFKNPFNIKKKSDQYLKNLSGRKLNGNETKVISK